ncbi:MAG: carboxypeptidase-like regulatory domain-containing protein [Acidobacteriota bacterium]|jgi:hypothetical protein
MHLSTVLLALVLLTGAVGESAVSDGCLLRARVVDDRGSPVPSARLGVRSLTTGGVGRRGSRLARADRHGRVELRLPRDVFRWAVASDRHPTTAERTLDLRSSCGEAEPVRVVLDPGNRITGRVVGPGDEPLAGAEVRVQHDPRTPSYVDVLDGVRIRPHREVATDAGGRFDLPGLAGGTEYRLDVRRPGFGPAERSVRPDAGDAESLVIRLEPSARLVVAVVDPDGRGIEGAEIRIELLGEAEAFGGTRVVQRTDPRGRHEEESLTPGETEIEVLAPGYEHRRRVVDLEAGAVHRERFELAPVPSAPVELRIEDADGRTVAGAAAHFATSPRSPGGTYLSARSDERGRIAWPRIPHGRYEISIQPPEGFVAERPPSLQIEVRGETVEREVVLRRPPGRAVEGKVLGADGEGLPGAVVHVSVARGVEARTDAEGRFRFAHLPYGEHAVFLRVRGVAGIPSRTGRVGRDPEPWLFHVPDGVEVSGRLLVPPELDPGGEPAGEWRISARREDGSGSASGWLDGDLTYRTPPLAPGTWALEATDGRAEGRSVVEIDRGDGPVHRDLAVEPPEGFPVFGTLSHRGGPLAGARVGLTTTSPPFRDHGAVTDRRAGTAPDRGPGGGRDRHLHEHRAAVGGRSHPVSARRPRRGCTDVRHPAAGALRGPARRG